MNIVELEQGTEEWLKFRREHIGASDASVITLENPWKTPYKLWLEKMGLYKQKTNPAMQRGTDLEPLARDYFYSTYGTRYLPAVVKHRAIPYLCASLDGLSEDRKSILEIKVPSQSDHETAKSGKIPVKYIPQLQHQMEVCEVDEVNYFSYNGLEGVLVKVPRDEDYIKNLLSLEEQFWESVQNFTPPECTGKDFTFREDPEWTSIANEFRDSMTKRKEWEKKEASFKEKLIEMANDNNTSGAGVKIIKVARKGSVCYDNIPELKEVDLEKYRKQPIEYWRVS